MGEFIMVQVGQCGNQIGSSFWPSVLQECGITSKSSKSLPTQQKALNSFFHIGTPKNHYKNYSSLIESKAEARAVLIDMENAVLARYQTGPLKDLFSSKCVISNYPGSGNNWAEGFCHHGMHYESRILDAIRRAVEKCDGLQGFLLLFSTSGGTGSGVGSFVLKLLADHYPHIQRFIACVYPIGTEDVITAPFNMALATQYINETASCVFPIENRALLDIVKKQLGDRHSEETAKFVSGCRPYEDMNQVIVNMLLHLTSGSRFGGALNFDVNDVATNMIPFPRLNFLLAGYSPLTVTSQNILNYRNSDRIKDELFVNCIHRNNQLIKTESRMAKVLAMALLGRGDFTVSDMHKYVNKLQKKCRLPSWSSKIARVGLCDVPPYGHSHAMLSVCNTTSMVSFFIDVIDSFNKLYKKKAHIHHYLNVDGFEEDAFKECRENLMAIFDTYREIECMKPVVMPRLIPK